MNCVKMKYKIGDTVKVSADKLITQKCPFCVGKGYRFIEGNKLYCQNCDEGKIVYRSTEQYEVDGTVIGFRMVAKMDNEDEDDENIRPEDGIYYEEEYFVTVPEGFVGYGTYNISKIRR